MAITEAQKRATYNWRQNHLEHMHELGRKHKKTADAKKSYYSYEKIAKQLRYIKIN